MWKKFNFFTAELLQSADPGSPLYAIQVFSIFRSFLQSRGWISRVLRQERVLSYLEIRREESRLLIRSTLSVVLLHMTLA